MYLAGDDDMEPDPGTPEFGQQAAQRRATILGTPLPVTSGPPLLFLPAQAIGQGVSAAAGAVGRGLFSGMGGIALLAGAGLAAYVLLKRSR